MKGTHGLTRSDYMLMISRGFAVVIHSKKIIANMLKETDLKDFLNNAFVMLNEGIIATRISRAKAKSVSPVELLDEWYSMSSRHAKGHKFKGKAKKFTPLTQDQLETDLQGLGPSQVIDYVVAHLYGRYQQTLAENNSLDFDDLLLYGVQLFGENPKVSEWCKHVLVDEL
jgi:DNA helicase II / ATP-dependent DNA helicase PcrA